MPTIIIYGEASKKIYKKIVINENELSLTILDFLIKHSIPIASSCLGEGICNKCVFNGKILACQLHIGEFMHLKIKDSTGPIISIAYL